jgi:hypothetical protein
MTIKKTSLPTEILNIIAEFANIVIETNNYKKNTLTTRFKKIKLICDGCNKVCNKTYDFYVLDSCSQKKIYMDKYFTDCDKFRFCKNCNDTKIVTVGRTFRMLYPENLLRLQSKYEIYSILKKNSWYFYDDVYEDVTYYHETNDTIFEGEDDCNIVPCKVVDKCIEHSYENYI